MRGAMVIKIWEGRRRFQSLLKLNSHWRHHGTAHQDADQIYLAFSAAMGTQHMFSAKSHPCFRTIKNLENNDSQIVNKELMKKAIIKLHCMYNAVYFIESL